MADEPRIILDREFLLRAAAYQDEITFLDVVRFLFGTGLVVAVFFLRAKIVQFLLEFIHKFDSLVPAAQRPDDKQLRSPLSFLIVMAAVAVADLVADYPDELELLHQHGQLTVLHIFLFWAVYMGIEPVSKYIHESGTRSFGDEVREVSVKVLKLLALIVGFLSILQSWGVNVGAFLAGLGLIGMAVALAAQDTMKNFFGSVVVLSDKIFSKGDWIKTPQVEGIVERFGLRTTVIRGFDDSLIHTPNATLADTTVTNFSRCKVRKIQMQLPLGAPATEDQLKKIVSLYKNYLVHNEHVVKPEKVIIVNLDKFGENCIELFIYFFVYETDWIPYLDVKQKIILEFKKLAAEAGVNFGVPTRYILLHQH